MKGVLDGCKLLTVMGAEVLAAGQAGDFLKRGLVQINPGVNAEEAFGAAVFRVRADADRVDFDAFFSGQARSGQRVDLPAVICAIGDQDQYAALGRALAQAFQGQADGIANGRVFARNANARFVQQVRTVCRSNVSGACR